MKTKVTLLILISITAATVLSAIALSHKIRATQTATAIQPKEFIVRGVVRVVDPEGKIVRIQHEEIPGYMPAMTMPLSVKEKTLLNGLQSGDAVKFHLAVTDDDSWISKIEKTPSETSGNSFAAQADAAKSVREGERLNVGETVPDFTLINQNGQSVRLSDFKGKAVILTFIYTRCPLPNFCPLMSKNFASLQERLSSEFPDQFQLLSVSIDPKFDIPGVLKSYSSAWSKNEKNWSFLTGTADQIESVGSLFGLFYEPSGGLINHDLRTALIGPDGKLIQVWKSNVWTPYEIQRTIRETLTGKRDLANK